MTTYLDAVSHGKIYTSCLDSALEVRKMNLEAKFVVPLRGSSWKRLVPNGRGMSISKFDVRQELAPSAKLNKSVKRKLLNADEFEMTYLLEMQQEKAKQSIEELAQMSLNGTSFIIFGRAPRGKICHRYALGSIISKTVCKLSNSRHASKIKAYAGEIST